MESIQASRVWFGLAQWYEKGQRRRTSWKVGLGGIQIVIPSYRPCVILGYSVLPVRMLTTALLTFCNSNDSLLQAQNQYLPARLLIQEVILCFYQVNA